VPGDTNGVSDVFVRDRVANTTTRVSVSSDGTQGDARSLYCSISPSGRFVVFTSKASNLVEGDTNGADDIFVHDRETGNTTRVSVGGGGVQGNKDSYNYHTSITADGRFVTFASLANNLVDGDANDSFDVFVHDRETGKTTCLSMAPGGVTGNGMSLHPSISTDDGRFVTFNSLASNLVPGDTNGMSDVFLHDRETGKTSILSLNDDNQPGNLGSDRASISADGRKVSFTSDATNFLLGDVNRISDVYITMGRAD
jgi:Tol biopolymer transport system component